MGRASTSMPAGSTSAPGVVQRDPLQLSQPSGGADRSLKRTHSAGAAGSVSAPGKVDSFEELFRFANQVGQVSIEPGATPGSLSTQEGTKLERTESLSDVLHRSLA